MQSIHASNALVEAFVEAVVHHIAGKNSTKGSAIPSQESHRMLCTTTSEIRPPLAYTYRGCTYCRITSQCPEPRITRYAIAWPPPPPRTFHGSLETCAVTWVVWLDCLLVCEPGSFVPMQAMCMRLVVGFRHCRAFMTMAVSW